MNLTIVLALVACILSVITLFQSKGQSLLSWAVFLLSLIYVLPVVR